MRPSARPPGPIAVTVVTGVSGAGKSTAVHALEDLGFFCVDNLPSPVLATSDHPVVIWPLAARSRMPQPNDEDGGLLDTLEVWVPVNPQCAILMTWADAKDDEILRVDGARQHASTLNAFTIAQADAPLTAESRARSPNCGPSRARVVASGCFQPFSRRNGSGLCFDGSAGVGLWPDAGAYPFIQP